MSSNTVVLAEIKKLKEEFDLFKSQKQDTDEKLKKEIKDEIGRTLKMDYVSSKELQEDLHAQSKTFSDNLSQFIDQMQIKLSDTTARQEATNLLLDQFQKMTDFNRAKQDAKILELESKIKSTASDLDERVDIGWFKQEVQGLATKSMVTMLELRLEQCATHDGVRLYERKVQESLTRLESSIKTLVKSEFVSLTKYQKESGDLKHKVNALIRMNREQSESDSMLHNDLLNAISQNSQEIYKTQIEQKAHTRQIADSVRTFDFDKFKKDIQRDFVSMTDLRLHYQKTVPPLQAVQTEVRIAMKEFEQIKEIVRRLDEALSLKTSKTDTHRLELKGKEIGGEVGKINEEVSKIGNKQGFLEANFQELDKKFMMIGNMISQEIHAAVKKSVITSSPSPTNQNLDLMTSSVIEQALQNKAETTDVHALENTKTNKTDTEIMLKAVEMNHKQLWQLAVLVTELLRQNYQQEVDPAENEHTILQRKFQILNQSSIVSSWIHQTDPYNISMTDVPADLSPPSPKPMPQKKPFHYGKITLNRSRDPIRQSFKSLKQKFSSDRTRLPSARKATLNDDLTIQHSLQFETSDDVTYFLAQKNTRAHRNKDPKILSHQASPHGLRYGLLTTKASIGSLAAAAAAGSFSK